MAEQKRVTWQHAAIYVLALAGIIWAIEVINSVLDHRLNAFGILPREQSGLVGILFWPFLHGGIGHLIVNTMPFVVLGWFVALRGPGIFFLTSLIIIVVGGLGVWAFGRSAFHVGASGLVFGYFGFLVARGIYERSIGALGIATFVLFYYGGMVLGIVPTGGYVSWEGHLFGLIAGILAARIVPLEKTL